MPDFDGPVWDTDADGNAVIRANRFPDKTGRHIKLYAPDGSLYFNDVLLFNANGAPAMLGHVLKPQDWGKSAGAHFWAVFGDPDQVTGGAGEKLEDHGWISVSVQHSIGGRAGDFLSSADIDPFAADFGSASDELLSPPIFGGYSHGLMASRFLGDVMPTKLSFEAFASFPVASANEQTSGFGFSRDTLGTAAWHVAVIRSNGANFQLRGDHDTDAGAAIDNAWHLFKAEIQSTGIQWWIDGVGQGTMTVDPVDLFPLGFGAHVTTTNRVKIAWAHVWYS